MVVPHAWFDEISFDSSAPLLQMGTRRLGDSAWLVRDAEREQDLAEKSRLLAERHDEVFAALPGSEVAGRRLLEMVKSEIAGWCGAPAALDHGEQTNLHPLEQAGRLVQEDLCLIHFRDGTWHLDAASLCFPSRWRLADKLGRPLVEVHGPVQGYDPVLSDRVNGVFEHLLGRADDRPVWRRNWFVHPNPARFQPSRPAEGDPVVPAHGAMAGLWVRSERQILRRVLRPDWAVFSIRIQQASLGELFVVPHRRERMARYFVETSESDAAHHGVSKAQLEILRLVLTEEVKSGETG